MLDQIYAKHPDLLKSDTLTQTDTLYLPETTIDTVYSYLKGDTVVVRDKSTGTKVTVRVDTVTKTVYVALDQSPMVVCKRQTIHQRTIIRVTVDRWPWWIKPLIGYSIITTVLVVILFLIRR